MRTSIERDLVESRERRLHLQWLAGSLASAALPAASAPVLRVGPTRSFKRIADAARAVQPGETVEVDAGVYSGDFAVWTKRDVTVRAVGGRVRLAAEGSAIEGKGIWVIRGAANMLVEGFDFEGAVVRGRNGAGIRFDKGSLKVRDCRFLNNEMGLLTGNEGTTVLELERCEFAHNHHAKDPNHNLYVGRIARLSVTACWMHQSRIGHLLKSRAKVNEILYNRLTDETGGRASYELEFPDGGLAYVVGNIIQQEATTENKKLVSFGSERYHWERNELHLVHNTLIDDVRDGGTFVYARPGAQLVRGLGNLLVGRGRETDGEPADWRYNVRVQRGDFQQSDPLGHLLQRVPPGWERNAVAADSDELLPKRQYVHPCRSVELDKAPTFPGALQRAS